MALQDINMEQLEQLEADIEVKLELNDIVKSPNVAELLPEDQLAKIGNQVYEDWEVDKQSRSDWEEKTAVAMKLALQVVEEKTFPWENASNVKFPIVTIAALQYQSRAYPSLIPGNNVVKARVFGEDVDGTLAAKANRISNYMSFQVLEEDDCWEKNMDEVLISQAIVGCAFKKSYFDPNLGHNVSEHVLAKDLYIPYFAKSLDKASRITEVLYVSQNDLTSRFNAGIYKELETESEAAPDTSGVLDEVTQESQGLRPTLRDSSAPRELLEQHRWLDLDDDDFAEPYIVTIDKETKQVLRIVARFFSKDIKRYNQKIVNITPTNYYTKFTFIPSPDGGIYDLGFGVLLGPLNESINTLLNQLVDAGTLSNTAGGFLGRGVKFRSGDNSFKPFEWKRVDSTGDDLRKGVVPLTVREPSMVLFQLLGMLIDYGERIGMAVDPLVGVNPGQNTPAETSRSMVAEGQRIFNAVFKRTYRSLKEEFRKLYKLNAIYLQDETVFNSLSKAGSNIILREDFTGDGFDVIPSADPNMVSQEQKIQQAQIIKASAANAPGLYNAYTVEKKLLEALGVEDIESVLPDPKGPNAIPSQPDTKVVVETMKIEAKNMQFKMEMQLKMFDLMQEIEYLRAEILEKESRAALNLASAEGIKEGHQIAAIQSAVAIAKQKQEGLIKALDVLRDLSGMQKEKKGLVDDITGGLDGMEEAPDDRGVVQVSNQPQGAA